VLVLSPQIKQGSERINLKCSWDWARFMTMKCEVFADLPKNHFGAILADPPWHFDTWGEQTNATTHVNRHYETMDGDQILNLPVEILAANASVLFLWVTWPTLELGMETITNWGFKYKTCGFAWMIADGRQVEMFHDEVTPEMLGGYWTRSNSEVCLLGTRGKPKRLNADVRQGIIAPRREHSRKPDGIHERIERLVAGPYLELFARQSRPGWTTWGNEKTKFDKLTA
jgi:N6-adenosine-specific RNA methylase IME4